MFQNDYIFYHILTCMRLAFFFISLSEQFKIKHADTESFICIGRNSHKEILVECKDKIIATEFGHEITNEGLGYIFPLGTSKVWNTTKSLKVEIRKKRGRKNQLYNVVFVLPDVYMIKSHGLCLTFISPDYFLNKCNLTNNQLFTIIYNDKEVNQMTETKKILNKSFFLGPAFEMLQKMIEDNKIIARHMARAHKYLSEKQINHELPLVINETSLPIAT